MPPAWAFTPPATRAFKPALVNQGKHQTFWHLLLLFQQPHAQHGKGKVWKPEKLPNSPVCVCVCQHGSVFVPLQSNARAAIAQALLFEETLTVLWCKCANRKTPCGLKRDHVTPFKLTTVMWLHLHEEAKLNTHQQLIAESITLQ